MARIYLGLTGRIGMAEQVCAAVNYAWKADFCWKFLCVKGCTL